MTLISSTRFFNGALLAGAMALISTEVAVAQPAPGTADSSGRLVQTWDKTFPRSEKVDHQKVTFKNRYGIFVRAYSGIRSKWYQAALSQQAGKILAIGQEFDVLFAKPSDPELESKIDQAYLKKYSGSSYVSAMTGIRARAATIEILPS